MNELDNLWHPEKMLEVQLKEPDDFLKVRETLTRIGVASRKDKKLFQSCHILHKQGRYFIVHFKELFALDGKKSNCSTTKRLGFDCYIKQRNCRKESTSITN